MSCQKEASVLLMEMEISTITMESSMEIPQKAKDRTAL
jgi:hypothetical protein